MLEGEVEGGGGGKGQRVLLIPSTQVGGEGGGEGGR
jgi:hypothetical protein